MPVWTNELRSFVRRSLFRSSRERWNYDYRRGQWEGLKGDLEVPRLEAVAKTLTKYTAKPRVLEIGCGEALVQQRLHQDDYSRWVGVDLSDVIIEKAQRFASPAVEYVAADMREFQTTERFDAILFTESLNYVKKCDRVIERYFSFLDPNGVIIVSLFEQTKSPVIWKEVDSILRVLETVVTENKRGKWLCKVLRPRSKNN